MMRRLLLAAFLALGAGSAWAQSGQGPTIPGGAMLSKSVTLSSAQLLAADTTPVPVLPAPGEGFFYFVFAVVYQSHLGTIAYTAGFGGLFYDGLSQNVDPGDQGIFGFPWSAVSLGPTNLTSALPSGVDNKAIVYFVSNGAFVGGNGTGVITVYYSIVPLS